MQTLLPVPVARSILARLEGLTDTELAALDVEVEEARVSLENLEAVRRAAHLSQATRLGLGPEPSLPAAPEPKRLPAPRVEVKTGPPCPPSPRGEVSGASLPSITRSTADRGRQNRERMAQHILRHGPSQQTALARATGVSDSTVCNMLKLGHPWFVKENDGLVHLTTRGHQEISGKDGSEE